MDIFCGILLLLIASLGISSTIFFAFEVHKDFKEFKQECKIFEEKCNTIIEYFKRGNKDDRK